MELKPGLNIFNVELTPKPPKLEDLDFTLLKYIAESIKIFDMPRKDRILTALNFLYDALAAFSGAQSFISIYGSLNFLTSGIGQQRNTLLSDAVTLFKFIDSGILNAHTAIAWMEKFRTFHSNNYEVLKGNKVDKQEMDEIKAFFKEFLMNYIEYEKVTMTHEVAE